MARRCPLDGWLELDGDAVRFLASRLSLILALVGSFVAVLPAVRSQLAVSNRPATIAQVHDRASAALPGTAAPAPSPAPTAQAATAPPSLAPAATSSPVTGPSRFLPPIAAPGSSWASPLPGSGPFFGLLESSGAMSSQELSAGITVGSLELAWSAYEPSPGVFNESYAASQRARLDQMLRAGQRVTLELGMNPPAWVYNLDSNTRFVDQYGDVFGGSGSGNAPNAVFDAAVRDAEAAYIAHVGADLGDSFWAVRAGGLLQDELRYPDANYNGHSNCYWAFDGNAQGHSPVPGWKPGTPDSTRAAAFMDYYLSSLSGFETWLLGRDRAAFPGAWLQVLLPSWGLRPGDVDAAVARNLDGSTPPASWGTLENGLDWQRQVAAISDRHVMLYSTWLERGDDGTAVQQLAPGHYLAVLGKQYGFPAAGENAGGDDLATMKQIVQRTRSWGLAGLMWFHEAALLSGSPVSLSAYEAAIAA